MTLLDRAATLLDFKTERGQLAIGVGHCRCAVPDEPHMAVWVDCQPHKDEQGFRRVRVNTVVYADAGQMSFADFAEMLHDLYGARNATMRVFDAGYWGILKERGIYAQQARDIDRSTVRMIYPKTYTGAEAKSCTSLAFAAASTALLEIESGLSFV